MSKFFIGQKVKVKAVSDTYLNYLLGYEGVVNELGCEWYSDTGEEVGGIGVTIDGDDSWAFAEWQLEPILPEGTQPLGYSFEQMMSEFGVTETDQCK